MLFCIGHQLVQSADLFTFDSLLLFKREFLTSRVGCSYCYLVSLYGTVLVSLPAQTLGTKGTSSCNESEFTVKSM
jgi:hypothetical protein